MKRHKRILEVKKKISTRTLPWPTGASNAIDCSR
jgi:hypothetical protein